MSLGQVVGRHPGQHLICVYAHIGLDPPVNLGEERVIVHGESRWWHRRNLMPECLCNCCVMVCIGIQPRRM